MGWSGHTSQRWDLEVQTEQKDEGLRNGLENRRERENRSRKREERKVE